MIDILGLVTIGVAAFVATNIDDIFVLMIFFSSLTFPVRQVVLGQFIGIGLLIAISALGSLISLVVPTYIIGLMGIIPIIIGIKNLVEIRKKNKSPSRQAMRNKKKNRSYFSFLSVAAITFSNGGDNIGVYVPLFSKYNTVSQITTHSSFHCNDCCLVYIIILFHESSSSCFPSTSYWDYRSAFCSHRTWNIHSD